MHFPRLVIAGAHSGAGKTTLALALMTLLAGRGHEVRPFKIGPDYIDPSLHRAAAGRVSRNLDAWLLPVPALRRLFRRHASGTGISLIEGVMGLFDGLGASARCSTAHVASLLGAPVILTVNAEGGSLSAAALVSGFASFRPRGGPKLDGLRLAGVVLNRVSGSAHYDLLRRGIEKHAGIPCFGYIARNGAPALPQRHLGLVPAGEQERLHDWLARLADAVRETLDIPGLLTAARQAPPLRERPLPARKPGAPSKQTLPARGSGASPKRPFRVRLGVARDAAFSFYYQDNLDCLEELGAELIACSPLNDACLPEDLDGLYLGGGFPEVFARQLEDNASFRQSLRRALERGLPAFAECGGMVYLCAGISAVPPGGSRPRRFAMTGFFPREAEMTARLQPFGYVTATLLETCVLGRKGDRFQAHEFHYSRLNGETRENGTAGPVEQAGLEADARALHAGPAVRVEKADGRTWTDGLRRKNVLAMYPHVHFHGCPKAARAFVAACRRERRRREGSCARKG